IARHEGPSWLDVAPSWGGALTAGSPPAAWPGPAWARVMGPLFSVTRTAGPTGAFPSRSRTIPTGAVGRGAYPANVRGLDAGGRCPPALPQFDGGSREDAAFDRRRGRFAGRRDTAVGRSFEHLPDCPAGDAQRRRERPSFEGAADRDRRGFGQGHAERAFRFAGADRQPVDDQRGGRRGFAERARERGAADFFARREMRDVAGFRGVNRAVTA